MNGNGYYFNFLSDCISVLCNCSDYQVTLLTYWLFDEEVRFAQKCSLMFGLEIFVYYSGHKLHAKIFDHISLFTN